MLITVADAGVPVLVYFAMIAVGIGATAADFLGISAPNFRGGARTAAGDFAGAVCDLQSGRVWSASTWTVRDGDGNLWVLPPTAGSSRRTLNRT